MIHCI